MERYLASGLAVYLVEWQEPGTEDRVGFADYADRLLLVCLRAIEAETGQSRAVLLGHFLVAPLAVIIFASLHPERVQGLVLLLPPLRFGSEAGVFGPLAQAIAEMPASRAHHPYAGP